MVPVCRRVSWSLRRVRGGTKRWVRSLWWRSSHGGGDREQWARLLDMAIGEVEEAVSREMVRDKRSSLSGEWSEVAEVRSCPLESRVGGLPRPESAGGAGAMVEEELSKLGEGGSVAGGWERREWWVSDGRGARE